MAFEFEKELAAFTQIMRDKLTENQHKGTWKQETADWLVTRMFEECNEVIRAITHDEGAEAIARECADVACFAMMIADVCAEFEQQD